MTRRLKYVSVALLPLLLPACATLDGLQSSESEPVAAVEQAKPEVPNTAPAASNAAAAVDTDRDGVADPIDRCPATPPGQLVGADGCSQCNELLAIVTNLNFEFDSAVLTPDAAAKLDPIGETLRNNQAINVSVEGHTDSVGAAEYNQSLSQTRASAVVEHLARQGVAQERMKPLGLGESMPLVENNTPVGRAINRRVEFRVACAQ